MSLLDAFLSRLRWYRRLRGGHWERWAIDSPVNGRVWLRERECWGLTGVRPALGRGNPTCETHA